MCTNVIMTSSAYKLVFFLAIIGAAASLYWVFWLEDNDNTTPSPGGGTPSPGGGTPSPGVGITDYEDYITNITFDWGTENTIGIINNNTYAPTPTELYESEVNEATRILLDRTVDEFDTTLRDSSISNYELYCKLKIGMLNTHGILSGPLYELVTTRECVNEANLLQL